MPDRPSSAQSMHAGEPLFGLDRFQRGRGHRLGALSMLLALFALVVTGLLSQPVPAPQTSGNDLTLYLRVIDDIKQGENYYAAAIRDLREGHYPLRPFVTVRPPVLAEALALLPNEDWRALALDLLTIATVAAWAWRLIASETSPIVFALSLGLLGTGVLPAFADGAYAVHEIWAGVLIALSLALRRQDRWAAALVLGLLAAAIRELAAPYLVVMAFLAWRDGCHREAYGWLAGVIVFVIGTAVHAWLVSQHVVAADLASPGWIRFSGWPFVLETASWNGVLSVAPRWLAGIAVPVALLGLSLRAGPMADRLALTVVGYTLGFAIVGRPDNAYWGMIIAPLWPLGLAMAWPALSRLVALALPARPTSSPAPT